MCLAIPARITAIDHASDTAEVTLDGVARSVSLALLDSAEVGDYVLIHVGYALNRIDPEEAERTLETIREAGLLAAPGDAP
ncbi:HypC/HybG/HupF family hydrogenase formation chaperone [Marichromatium bheemlicum]|uniref:HypC/HybG/HupF family hydrogenase formation chaperone n=1 Tax=Marichromatium bheemlicum TaxID=365339 RepID=A0ABX1IDC9_9GAMM|nr:HypC/HybG/HupF family hydrogenase formation chaperone [Marichromatium bheemlicum]NKN34086.1 HypC/HybG/HupF family hydrogenase formation chaperone [Marichromatium bheemlicum]